MIEKQNIQDRYWKEASQEECCEEIFSYIGFRQSHI